MFAPGKKGYDYIDSILKSRDITLPTKVHLIKAMAFPVVMYGCESWTIKKAECWKIDVFELWCCRRLLRVPWTVKRYSQSILQEISPEHSLEGLMLKLKLQYFGHLIGKDPDVGKDWRWEEKGTTEDEMVGWHHQFDGHEFEQALGVDAGQGSLACCSPWPKSWIRLSDWTEQVLEYFLTFVTISKKLTDESNSLEISKKMKKLGMWRMNKIYVDTSLLFTIIKYIQIYCKRLKFIITYVLTDFTWCNSKYRETETNIKMQY